MKIVFAATQSLAGSTMIGRVLPLARYFSRQHHVTVLGLRASGGRRASSTPGVDDETPGVFPARRSEPFFCVIGREPFQRTANGKRRLRGLPLIINMLATALRTAWQLQRLHPDCAIIVKTLPHNVLGAYLYKNILRGRARIIADADDFELMANAVTSLNQRAAIHWAEHTAVALADAIVTATPFLTDHFSQLAGNRPRSIIEIPTGLDPALKQLALNYKFKPTLLYLGSLSVASGHRVDLLPDILAGVRQRVPDAQLFIAGRGDDAQSLHREFSDRGLTSAVTWQAQFSPPDWPDLLSRGQVLIDPIDSSIVVRAKSSSRTLLAAAAGFPIVTSNIGIRPYFLPDALHERFFAAPGNIQMYIDKVIALLRQPLNDAERTAMRRRAQPYLWPNLSRRYLKLITAA
ncbi:MAG: glycosyltransferase [Candidatus Andersenbacteria bacterium]|nr:glycosyltransferase [Candidatus Andersenbacteria bacterium]